MRVYQPLGTVEALERFLAEPSVAQSVAARRVLPARAAQTAPIPSWLDGRLVAGLSVSAPADRLEESWLDRVKETAARISAALGHGIGA